MISISNCFRRAADPEHILTPFTSMSDRVCPGELKCSATGKPVVFFSTLRTVFTESLSKGTSGFPDIEFWKPTAQNAVHKVLQFAGAVLADGG